MLFCRPLAAQGVCVIGAGNARNDALREAYEASLQRARRDRLSILHWMPQAADAGRLVHWGSAFASEHIATTEAELLSLIASPAGARPVPKRRNLELCGQASLRFIRQFSGFCFQAGIGFAISSAAFMLSPDKDDVRMDL